MGVAVVEIEKLVPTSCSEHRPFAESVPAFFGAPHLFALEVVTAVPTHHHVGIYNNFGGGIGCSFEGGQTVFSISAAPEIAIVVHF